MIQDISPIGCYTIALGYSVQKYGTHKRSNGFALLDGVMESPLLRTFPLLKSAIYNYFSYAKQIFKTWESVVSKMNMASEYNQKKRNPIRG